MKRSILVSISGISLLAFLITGAIGEVIQSPKAKELQANKQMSQALAITPPKSSIVEINTSNYVYIPLTNILVTYSISQGDWYYVYGTTNFNEKPWIKWHDKYSFKAPFTGIFTNNWVITNDLDKFIKVYHFH